MRGAQPDAVCPRCDHHQPPSDTPLSHCKQCGLTFQPKELLVRSRRPTPQPVPDAEPPAFDAALVVAPPTSLTVEETDEQIDYRWTDHSDGARIWGLVATILYVLLWTSNAAANDKIGFTFVLGLIALFGFLQSRRSVKLRITRNQILTGKTTLLLSDVEQIFLDGTRITACTWSGKMLLLAAPRDREIAAYLRNQLVKRIEKPASDSDKLKP